MAQSYLFTARFSAPPTIRCALIRVLAIYFCAAPHSNEVSLNVHLAADMPPKVSCPYRSIHACRHSINTTEWTKFSAEKASKASNHSATTAQGLQVLSSYYHRLCSVQCELEQLDDVISLFWLQPQKRCAVAPLVIPSPPFSHSPTSHLPPLTSPPLPSSTSSSPITIYTDTLVYCIYTVCITYMNETITYC